MPTRPFSRSTVDIAGTTRIGSLVVGRDPLDYSSKPGGVTWWMGPEEYPRWIIAKDVAAANFPTPVGNSGNVQFWGVSEEVSFKGFVEGTVGQTFADVATAKSWLNSNGYWTNFTFSLGFNNLTGSAGVEIESNELTLPERAVLAVLVDPEIDQWTYTIGGSLNEGPSGEWLITDAIEASTTVKFAFLDAAAYSGTVTIRNGSSAGSLISKFTVTVTSSDVTPNAINWADITGLFSGSTNAQTISGINTSITLRVESNYNAVGQFNIYIDDVVYQMAEDLNNNGYSDHVINDGDVVYFQRLSSGQPLSESVTIKNVSDGNAILDTFSITLTGDDQGGGG